MVQLHTADNVLWMRKNLKDNSQSLIVTSPPYFLGVRQYGGHSWSFPDVAHEIKRVLKPGGVCIWVVGDSSKNWCEQLGPQRQSIYWTDVVKMKLIDTMIYAKTSVTFPPRKTYSQQFEFILVLAKDGPPKYFNPIMKINRQYGKLNNSVSRKGKNDELVYSGKTFKIRKEGIHSNIFECGQGFRKSAADSEAFSHSAICPFKLCYQMTKSFSPRPSQKKEIENFTMFEPFLGSGQSLLAGLGCGLLPENLSGVDQNSTYVELARRRLSDPVILSKNMQGLKS
jgi:DNA modification methylase